MKRLLIFGSRFQGVKESEKRNARNAPPSPQLVGAPQVPLLALPAATQQGYGHDWEGKTE